MTDDDRQHNQSETNAEPQSPADGSSGAGESDQPQAEGAPKKKRRRRKRRGKSASGEGESARAEPGDSGGDPDERDDGDDGSLRRAAPAPVDPDDPDLFDVGRSFADLGLDRSIVEAIESAGFRRPTLIQAQLIPPALAGRDVLGQAKTGTGKTAAFGLPLIQLVEPGVASQALVLAPTRELALQICDGLRLLAKGTPIRVTPIYGGQSINVQADKLKKKPEIIVATPGRVQDMVERGHLRFDNFRFVVLDEVDRMLDIGFRDDIRRILRRCPAERQTIMVSATIAGEIEDLARRFMRNPEKIVTASGSLTVKLVEQHYMTVSAWDKKRLLIHLLTHEEPALTLVFCRLKRTVDDLAGRLQRKGIEAIAIHGDMRQNQRENVIKKLRAGRLGVVIASDLASRGLDVEGITHVVNYDLPEDPEIYVHRIGRTARAGRAGVAWSFVTPEQGKLLTEIEKLIDTHIPKMEYPDFEPSPRPDGWRDEMPGGRPVVAVESLPVRSRFSPTAPPPAALASRQSKGPSKKIEEKFPGGIVPTKLPSKRLGGKVRTTRTNKTQEWDRPD